MESGHRGARFFCGLPSRGLKRAFLELEISMKEYSVAVIVGSLRRDSFNRKLADAVAELVSPRLTFKDVSIGQLPLYSQDDDERPAQAVRDLKQQITAAHGLLFVTPEYNRSIPGVLKNALDHASRPYGQSAWAGKPAGILGVSIGAVGTAVAQQHLRTILAYLDMPTLGQPEVFFQASRAFDDAGNLAKESRRILQGWSERYIAWLDKHVQ